MAGLLKSLGNTVDAQRALGTGLGVGNGTTVLTEPETALVVTVGVDTAVVGEGHILVVLETAPTEVLGRNQDSTTLFDVAEHSGSTGGRHDV